MQDKGIELSDQEIKKLSRFFDKIYYEAYQEILQKYGDEITELSKLTDEELSDLDEEAKRLARQKMAIKVQSNNKLILGIASIIAIRGLSSKTATQNALGRIFRTNYVWASYDITLQAKLDLANDFADFLQKQINITMDSRQTVFTKIAYKNLQSAKTFTPRLKRELVEAIKKGESQQKIIKRIQEVTNYSKARAKRIAQTERNRIQSQARFECMQDAVSIGIEMEKQWIARLIRTREMHQQTHLEVQKANKQFSNGLMFPGDPNGKPENTINCFCVLKPMVQSVLPALAKSREKYRKMAFEDFEKRMNRKREK